MSIMASPEPFTPVRCAQGELALVSEENGAPMLDLLILEIMHEVLTGPDVHCFNM